MATDLLNRIATEDDEEYTLQPGSRYTNNKSNNRYYTPIEQDNNNEIKQSKKKVKRGQNGYITVDINGDEEAGQSISKNPFDALDDTFNASEDPEKYVIIYKHIKQNIRAIEENIDDVAKLRDNFNLSDSQQQYQSIMNELDEIMMKNSKLNRYY